MNRLEKVLSSNMCTGCGICVSSPNEMRIDDKGFARPMNQIFDDISFNACPGIGIEQLNHNNYDSSWGPVFSSQVGYSTDSLIRQNGSSGGVLTALLNMCLHEKLVDAVIQVGAAADNPVANETKIVTNQEELITNAGSRYAPSSPLSVIRQLIGDGKKYAIVGKPCDIAALRMVIRVNEQLSYQFPVLLSFMCAGVPSEHAADEIIKYFKLKHEDVREFRYRGDGWPGLTKAVTTNGVAKTMTYNESWGSILNRKLQARCKVCADGTGELSDITCADAWYESENGYPSFEEKGGRSLILTRTYQGERLLEKAIALGYIAGVEDFDLIALKKIQPYQYNRKSTLLVRLLVLKIWRINLPKYKNFSLFSLFLITPIIVTLKAAFGTMLRKLKGRF